MIDLSWLTEDYLNAIGYEKVTDDGQYGVYVNKPEMVTSLTYGVLPPKYRKITFNRDIKYGIFLGVQSDWDTRYSIKNALANSKEVFEILLNAAV